MKNQKVPKGRNAAKTEPSNKLTKKLTGQYKASSVLAQIHEVLSTANDTDIKELANQAHNSNSVVGAFAHLDTQATIGKELGSWIISRRGHKVRVVIKAAKVAAHMHLKRRPASQKSARHRRQDGSTDPVTNNVSNESMANDELQSRASQ